MSNKIFKPTLKEIKQVMENKGYVFFTKGDYNVNIIGIRTSDITVNKFNDWMTLTYNEAGKEKFNIWPCTTDPGLYWLKNPSNVVYVPELGVNKKGTAILVPNQYRGCYTIRLHAGKYPAMCEKGGKEVSVYRDWNLDNYLDMKGMPIQTGQFGINIHHAGTDSENIDKWSAGCQVFKRLVNFDFFMSICYKSKDLYGNTFTYTLLTEKDFN